jgi:iron complex outermembrane receptor protein
MVADLAAPQATAQTDGEAAGPAVLVSASRSNIAANQAPQMVVIIKQQEIGRQPAIWGSSSDVLSSVMPSYTPSRGMMNCSGRRCAAARR